VEKQERSGRRRKSITTAKAEAQIEWHKVEQAPWRGEADASGGRSTQP
jgi:hypothetical protein